LVVAAGGPTWRTRVCIIRAEASHRPRPSNHFPSILAIETADSSDTFTSRDIAKSSLFPGENGPRQLDCLEMFCPQSGSVGAPHAMFAFVKRRSGALATR